MRKYFTGALALALIATMLVGCRKNVNDNKDGVITDPTVASTTAATMPSTDTAPAATTQPHASTGETVRPGNGNATQGTDNTNPTDHTGTATEPGAARSRRATPPNMH